MGEHIGYGAVAATMASDRDLSIFRRFGMLNTRNLLYLQSDLMSLETRLQELDAQADDVKKGNATWSIPRSWYYLEHDNGEHLATVLRIREVLEKYSMSAYPLHGGHLVQPWQNLPSRATDRLMFRG